MKNNQSDFDNEFNDKVIRVLEDNKKNFVTNWNENETELKKTSLYFGIQELVFLVVNC